MVARRRASGAGEAQPHPAPSPEEIAPLDPMIAGLADLEPDQLRLQWRNHLGGAPPAHLPRWLLTRLLAYRLQAIAKGDLDKATLKAIRRRDSTEGDHAGSLPFTPRNPAMRDGVDLKAGALLVREWNGKLERVMILESGFTWNGKPYGSLSQIAKAMTGTCWNGHRFFGLRTAHSSLGKSSNRRARSADPPSPLVAERPPATTARPSRSRPPHETH